MSAWYALASNAAREKTTHQMKQQKQNANQPKTARQSQNKVVKALGSRPRPANAGDSQGRSGLARPSEDYLRALADPFEGPLATIPDFPSLPSRRLRVWSKGFFSTGTAQFGFIMFDPYAAAANDLDSVWYSGATYAGSVSSVNTATVGVAAAKSNSDYQASSFVSSGVGNQARIVGAGLRIRYSSTELNRGGVVAGATSPNHFTLSGFTFDQINAYECSNRFRPQQKWVSALYCPVYNNELIYSTGLGSRGGILSGAYTPTPIMGFFVQAPDASTQIAFEYEAFVVLEAQGTNIRGLTPSYSDPTGFAAALTTAQLTMMRPTDNALSAHANRLVAAAGHVASNTITGMAKTASSSVLKWLEGAAGTVLTGALLAL